MAGMVIARVVLMCPIRARIANVVRPWPRVFFLFPKLGMVRRLTVFPTPFCSVLLFGFPNFVLNPFRIRYATVSHVFSSNTTEFGSRTHPDIPGYGYGGSGGRGCDLGYYSGYGYVCG